MSKEFTGRSVRGGKSKLKVKYKGAPLTDKGEEKGGILIQDLWMQGTYSIHDMPILNTEVVSYQSKTPDEVPKNC